MINKIIKGIEELKEEFTEEELKCFEIIINEKKNNISKLNVEREIEKIEKEYDEKLKKLEEEYKKLIDEKEKKIIEFSRKNEHVLNGEEKCFDKDFKEFIKMLKGIGFIE